MGMFHFMGEYIEEETGCNGRSIFRQSGTDSPFYIWWFAKKKRWVIGAIEDSGTGQGWMYCDDPQCTLTPDESNALWVVYNNGEWKEEESIVCEGKKAKIAKKEKKIKKIIFQPAPMGFEFRGNLIINVKPNGQANDAGVCCGWKIVQVNGVYQSNNGGAIGRA